MLVKALKTVLRRPKYLFLAIGVSVVVFAFAVWLPNLGLIWGVLTSSDVNLGQKLSLPMSLLGSITTNFTLLSASYTIAIAVLLGIYVSLLVYYLRRRIAEAREAGVTTGFLGVMTGMLGLGCAACGSLIITSILSVAGASWVLSRLPLGGQEFGIIGTVLLLVASLAVAKRINNPTVCKI